MAREGFFSGALCAAPSPAAAVGSTVDMRFLAPYRAVLLVMTSDG